jgi:hypothetical protein
VPTATIDELTIADEASSWSRLGFTLSSDCCQIGTVRLRFTGSDSGHGITGWSLRGIASTQLDGLPTEVSGRPAPAGAAAHANGVIAIDHVVAMSPALDRSVAALQGAGLDLRRVREEPTPAAAPRQAFFRLGEEILELIQEPYELVRRAGGIERPARFWGLALVAESLEATVERLGEHAGEIRPAVQPGRQIATVRRSAGLAIPIALMSPAADTAAR